MKDFLCKVSMHITDIISTIKEYKPEADTSLLELAYEFACDAHKGQMRKNGEEYIQHCLATAYRLAKIHMDESTIIAGLLHDVLDETRITADELEKNFGKDVAQLVTGVSKLGNIKYRGIERYAEDLRKMFVSIAHDIRIILIKFADRYHNLETLDVLPVDKRYRIAREVLEIYCPIADRLGIWYMKSKLEDLAYPYVYPNEFSKMHGSVSPLLEGKEQYIEDVKDMIEQKLRAQGIVPILFERRVKTLHSIYRKMIKKELSSVEGIYDIVALRVVVSTVADCYATLGIIHQYWRPFPGRIKDYIAQPKPNNYRALHTTVFFEKGEIIELQIQTPEMHAQAKFGIAAHWHYDESQKRSRQITENLDWLQEIVRLWNEKEEAGDESFQSVALDLFKNRIFVFTPKGDVINLSEDATPIDFAYAIHSDIGRRCAGAKINNQLQPLDSTLRSGDVVEILIEKNRKSPSPAWLAFAKTTLARTKIRIQMKETNRL